MRGHNGTYSDSQISGRGFVVSKGGVATRDLAPGERVPQGAHAVTPHPDKRLRAHGWRLAWIFLTCVLIFGCPAWLYINSIAAVAR